MNHGMFVTSILKWNWERKFSARQYADTSNKQKKKPMISNVIRAQIVDEFDAAIN